MSSVGVDFDFAKWISERRHAQVQSVREGAAYAFAGERKFRKTLAVARPVTMALEATTRLWKDVAKAELLGTSVKVTDQQYPRIYVAAQKAAAALKLRTPALFVTPTVADAVKVLGDDDTPYLLVGSQVADRLSDDELVAAIGQQYGHIQNRTVLYTTSLHYLTNSAAFFIRWVVQPAIMTLQAWSRRADVTCDRAAMLAVKSEATALSAIVKLALGPQAAAQTFDVEAYLRDTPADAKKGFGRYAELFRSHPYVPKRVTAMRWFAESAYFAGALDQDQTGKPSMDDIDKRVADLISVI